MKNKYLLLINTIDYYIIYRISIIILSLFLSKGGNIFIRKTELTSNVYFLTETKVELKEKNCDNYIEAEIYQLGFKE